MSFQPYSYPQPNTLIQEGTRVIINGLESEAGQRFNGKTGTAKKFDALRCRWAIKVDMEDAPPLLSVDITKVTIPDGEARVCIVTKENPGWEMLSQGGHNLVLAGTTDGFPAICILDNPTSPEFDKDRFYKECSGRGVPKGVVDGFRISVTSESGRNLFYGKERGTLK